MWCVWSSAAKLYISRHFFGSTVVDNVLAELFVSYESVVDTREVLLLASSRIGAHGVAFLYVVVKNGNEIHCVLNEFLILLCSFSQEVPARAVDDAGVPL